MRDWLDAIPNLGVPGVPGVQPQKSAALTGTPEKMAGVPGVPSADDCRKTLRRWHTELARLDKADPRSEIDPRRWYCLVGDAWWLYENHGKQLAEEGWPDLDAFGVSLRRPGGEVLLDRLDGSRSLIIYGKGRAGWGWSYTNVTYQAARGYAEMQPAGRIQPIWILSGARRQSI